MEVLKNVDKKLRELKAPTGEEHNPAMSCHDVKENHPDRVKKRTSYAIMLPEINMYNVKYMQHIEILIDNHIIKSINLLDFGGNFSLH